MKNIMSITNSTTRIVLAVGGLLLVPFVAMQFSNEVVWSLVDFVIAGGLLLALGAAIELVVKKFPGTGHKAIAIAAIFVVFLLIWAELAVGIFGTPLAGT